MYRWASSIEIQSMIELARKPKDWFSLWSLSGIRGVETVICIRYLIEKLCKVFDEEKIGDILGIH